MKELDLDAIEARQRTARDAMTEDWQDNNAILDAVSGSMYDVPALVAEVRRLRDAVDAALALHATRERTFVRVPPGTSHEDARVVYERTPTRLVCSLDREDWPCATVRALTGEDDQEVSATGDQH